MIRIRKYRPGDVRAVARLISRTYRRFNQVEGTEEAVRRYVEFYDPDQNLVEVREHFRRTPVFFVALDGARVVGMVRGRENRIGNLFVRGAYHRRGIGTRLVQKFEEVCRKKGFSRVVLRGSLHAVPFYQALGYKKTTGVRLLHGLRIQPMAKSL